jgi:hypothetical protein
MNIRPGQLVQVTETHGVECEETRGYGRIWKKGEWPYTHSNDTQIPKGQICLVLEEPKVWPLLEISSVLVLIENPSLGFQHFQAYINPDYLKVVS